MPRAKKVIKKEEAYQRPSWDQYFLSLVEAVRSRGTCDRGRSGCVIAKDKRILSTGYVGSPIGAKHCDEIGHEMHTVVQEDGTKSRHCIRTTHCEQNAITNAARFGVSLEGSTMYVHMTPCYTCAKMIINAGVRRVVSAMYYHGGGRTKDIFRECGVEYELVNEETQKYDDM